jgi:hypothetical protein
MNRGSPPPPPSRDEVERKLLDLIEDRITREQASAWASPWVTAEDPGIDDKAVWDAVGALWGADGPTSDRPYLFGREDFEAWLTEFREKTSRESK